MLLQQRKLKKKTPGQSEHALAILAAPAFQHHQHSSLIINNDNQIFCPGFVDAPSSSDMPYNISPCLEKWRQLRLVMLVVDCNSPRSSITLQQCNQRGILFYSLSLFARHSRLRLINAGPFHLALGPICQIAESIVVLERPPPHPTVGKHASFLDRIKTVLPVAVSIGGKPITSLLFKKAIGGETKSTQLERLAS